MTAPATAPIRQTAEDGSRFYEWPGDPPRQFWSVTTALSSLNKEGLKWWAAKLAARRAMDNIPMMLAAQRFEPCGRTAARTEPFRCERCPDCVARFIELFHVGESTRRKHEGSAVHDALEAGILHGWDGIPSAADLGQKYIQEHPGIIQALPPYLTMLRKWIADYDLRPEDFQASEMTIFNEEYEYGGTLDAILRLVARNAKAAKMIARISGRTTHEAVDVVIDCKTREGEGKVFYGEHALQLTPYRRATHCMPSKVDRLLRPMPVTDGACILQVRPDGYTFEPVRTGPLEFDAFLAALAMFRWTVDEQAAAIAVKTFPVPEDFEFKTVKPTTRRTVYARKTAPDGKLCGCPGCDDPYDPVCMFGGQREPGSHVQVVDATGDEVKPPPRKRAPRKTAAKAAPAARTADDVRGSARMAGATLESIARTGGGGPGRSPYDDDIPF